MSLAEFLSIFASQMNAQNINHCILRNYEELPYNNLGNDIDFLILEKDLEPVFRIITEIKSVIITSSTSRYYVVSLFLNGINWGDGRSSIQIDLITSLSWKGLTYLNSETVIKKASEIPASGGLLKKPAAEHEAIISFFSSYLVGGWIKDRYQKKVQLVFSKQKIKVSNILQLVIKKKLATSLVNAVILDERDFILSLLPMIRFQLFLRHFFSNPIKIVSIILKYYVKEVKIRFTQYPIINICFLGPDGSGKSSIINSLETKLEGTVKEISYTHLKPNLKKTGLNKNKVNNSPHSIPPRSAPISIMKLLWWIFLYWKGNFFHKRRNSTLCIWDRYFYDVQIDPARYRYGAPLWIAKILGKLVPKPGVIFVLDAAPETIYERKQEVSLQEIRRQKIAYRQFCQNTSNCILLNTDKDLESSKEECFSEIIGYMCKRQKKHTVDIINVNSASYILEKVFAPKQLKLEARSIKNNAGGEYLVISNKKKARWIIPKKPIAGLQVLEQWSPYKKSTCIMWYILRKLYQLHLLEFIPSITKLTNEHECILALSNSNTNVIPVVYVGTPGPQQKAVITLVNASSYKPVTIMKVALTDGAKDSILKEAETLNYLEKLGTDNVPKLMLIDGDKYSTFQTVLPGMPTSRKLTRKHIDWLIQLPIFDKTTSFETQAKKFHKKIEENPNRFSASEIVLLNRSINILFSHEKIPLILVHGDFLPWNIKCSNNSLLIMDWEDSKINGFPLWDLCHYLLLQAHLFRVHPPVKLLLEGEIINYYLKKIGICKTKKKMLILIYCLHQIILLRNVSVEYKDYLLAFLPELLSE